MKVQFISKKSAKKAKLASILSLRSLFQGTTPDQGLLLSVFGLIIFGWVMVYSASALFAENRYHDQYFFLKRQIIWSVLGMGCFLVTANMPLHLFQKHAKKLYAVTLVLLGLVLVIGPEIAGARRWIRLGGLSFQPSELAKLCMVLVVADYMDRRQSRLRYFKKGLAPLLAMVGGMIGLILMEPDLGTPVLMSGVFLCMLILGGARWGHLFLMAVAAIPPLVASVVFVSYRLKRLFAYLNPWSDPQGTGYQLVQSLLALGSGGVLGRGLGNSQIKIGNLPDAHTDFVFAVLGEELGLIGTLFCAALFFFLSVRGLKVVHRAPTFFARLVAAGCSLLIGFQALINMGVASGMFPTKGMPLPFISFGGSSLLVMMVIVGLLANISRLGKLSAKAES